MFTELVHLGFGNMVAINKVVAIVFPKSAPLKRLVQEAKSKGLVIDVTNGRKTKAILIMDTGQLVLAAITPETIAGRIIAGRSGSPLKEGSVEESQVE